MTQTWLCNSPDVTGNSPQRNSCFYDVSHFTSTNYGSNNLHAIHHTCIMYLLCIMYYSKQSSSVGIKCRLYLLFNRFLCCGCNRLFAPWGINLKIVHRRKHLTVCCNCPASSWTTVAPVYWVDVWKSVFIYESPAQKWLLYAFIRAIVLSNAYREHRHCSWEIDIQPGKAVSVLGGV